MNAKILRGVQLREAALDDLSYADKLYGNDLDWKFFMLRAIIYLLIRIGDK